MNKLVRDPAPRFVPTKFDHDPIRTAPGRAVTVWGNARQATTIPLEPNLGWGVKTYLLCMVDIKSADVLATQGARASATMILIMMNWINSFPSIKGQNVNFLHRFWLSPSISEVNGLAMAVQTCGELNQQGSNAWLEYKIYALTIHLQSRLN